MHVVLISCVQGKKSGTHKAKNLYDSALFHGQMNYAKKLNPDKIYILSAKYGLLPLNKQVSKYNQTLNNATAAERQEWGKQVVSQLKRAGINTEEARFTILAGSSYAEGLKGRLKNIKEPMKDLGFGERLQWLKRRVELRCEDSEDDE